jgi:hypothetical protein
VSELTNLMIMVAEASRVRDKFKVQRDELLTATKLVLLFHSNVRWTEDNLRHWLAVTGGKDATTKSLCDHIRAVIAKTEAAP